MATLGDEPKPLPPVSFGAHMIDYLFALSPYRGNGMGIQPVSFEEIRAWQLGCKHSLDGWEFQLLRDMSVAYTSSLEAADDMNCPSPWLPVLDDSKRKEIAVKVRNIFKD